MRAGRASARRGGVPVRVILSSYLFLILMRCAKIFAFGFVDFELYIIEIRQIPVKFARNSNFVLLV